MGKIWDLIPYRRPISSFFQLCHPLGYPQMVPCCLSHTQASLNNTRGRRRRGNLFPWLVFICKETILRGTPGEQSSHLMAGTMSYTHSKTNQHQGKWNHYDWFRPVRFYPWNWRHASLPWVLQESSQDGSMEESYVGLWQLRGQQCLLTGEILCFQNY